MVKNGRKEPAPGSIRVCVDGFADRICWGSEEQREWLRVFDCVSGEFLMTELEALGAGEARARVRFPADCLLSC